jgi:hypothetical protein
MVASFLTPGTDMDLLVRHRDLKLRLCTKLKTYFDFPTFIGHPKLPRKAGPTQSSTNQKIPKRAASNSLSSTSIKCPSISSNKFSINT